MAQRQVTKRSSNHAKANHAHVRTRRWLVADLLSVRMTSHRYGQVESVDWGCGCKLNVMSLGMQD